jgi:hypothetical protein
VGLNGWCLCVGFGGGFCLGFGHGGSPGEGRKRLFARQAKIQPNYRWQFFNTLGWAKGVGCRICSNVIGLKSLAGFGVAENVGAEHEN